MGWCGWPASGGKDIFLLPVGANKTGAAPKSSSVSGTIAVAGGTNRQDYLTYADAAVNTALWVWCNDAQIIPLRVIIRIYWTIFNAPGGDVDWYCGIRAMNDTDPISAAIPTTLIRDTTHTNAGLHITNDIIINVSGVPQKKSMLQIVVDRDGVNDTWNQNAYLLAVKGTVL